VTKRTAATNKERAMREKLRELVERGVEGESVTARHKLERLESRFDFEAVSADEGPDLFSGRVSSTPGKARALKLKGLSSEVACYIKWALHAAFGVETSLRHEANGAVAVLVEASKTSLPTLNHVAEVIQRNFETLWSQFSGFPGASERDAKMFLLGLYDGMMDDRRAAGEPLPHRAPKKPPGRRKAKAKSGPVPAAHGLSIHPYETALDLGKKIRLSVPLEAIADELMNKETVARLGAA
jgi:hypothetical protein